MKYTGMWTRIIAHMPNLYPDLYMYLGNFA